MAGKRSSGSVATALQRLRGIGPRLARDFAELGVRRVQDLRGADPESLYERLCTLRGAQQDRCVLYAFRCAVYQAAHSRPARALCDWWAWKDRPVPSRRSGARARVARG